MGLAAGRKHGTKWYFDHGVGEAEGETGHRLSSAWPRLLISKKAAAFGARRFAMFPLSGRLGLSAAHNS